MPIDGYYPDSSPESNIHFLIDPATKAKAEASYTRRIIRKSDFTRAERDVLISLANLWFYHRNGRKGFVHPGRKVLAKKARVSVVTVARALSTFRELSFLKPIKYEKGGTGCATQYAVSLRAIWDHIDPDNIKILPGELRHVSRKTVSLNGKNDTVSGGRNDTVYAYQNDTLSISTHSTAFLKSEGQL